MTLLILAPVGLLMLPLIEEKPILRARSMAETQDQWYHRQAVEQLAQHIPFERDSASKAEQIEMLRGLVLRHGRDMDPELFGFEARNELIRLGLWSRIGPEGKA
jgi:gamma-glutamyl-gamma-aminobutyrate hydrolase PuuD